MTSSIRLNTFSVAYFVWIFKHSCPKKHQKLPFLWIYLAKKTQITLKYQIWIGHKYLLFWQVLCLCLCLCHAAYPRVHLASYVSPRLDRAISRPVCFLGQASTVCLQLFTGLPPHSILVQGIGIQAL